MASQELINIIIKATDEASAAAEKVSSNLNKIKNSSSRLSSIPGFDTMKTKLSNVAQTIDSKFGGALTKARNKFTTFKNGVSNVASTIKGKFGGALDGVRAKLSSVSNGTKNLAGGMSFLKGAVSMTAGMIGFELVNSLMETTRASLNARSSMQAFANRLNMSGAEVDKFQQSLDELQNVYKKVDMDVVGQQATDMAYRLGLPKTSLTELTETTAIFNDAMQRNGRSSEDAMMAMADAMDGQFVRLKEIGISQEDLMKNGWDGDINNKTGLLEAMNKSLKDQHYDDLAKSVDTLDDAWQVLSITLSNLLESIIVPLTPAIVGIVSAVTDVANFLKDAFAGMPDWAKVGLGIAGLAIGFGLLAGAISVAAAAEGGMMALMPGFITSLYGAASGFMAISIAGAPLWAIVAAVAAIAFAVYEVGKAFGWWKDVGTMLEAISAGASRLWSAFINHPDVQAAIEVISNALSTLWSWITQAGQAILDFFNINNSGSFDIIHAMVVNIGNAWNMVRAPIMALVGIFSSVIGGLYNLISGNQNAVQVITSIWNSLVANMPVILTALYNVHKAIFRMIASAVVNLVRSMVNRVVSTLSGLIGKARSALMGVVSSIRSAIQAWINAAVAKVKDLVSRVTGPFSGIAGTISGALSGVKNAITAPFQAAWKAVQPIVDKIQGALKIIPGVAGAAGGDDDEFSGNAPFKTQDKKLDVVLSGNSDLNLNLNVNGLPSGVDEDAVISILNDVFNDPDWKNNLIMEIVKSSVFQRLDAKEKLKISGISRRARGV